MHVSSPFKLAPRFDSANISVPPQDRPITPVDLLNSPVFASLLNAYAGVAAVSVPEPRIWPVIVPPVSAKDDAPTTLPVASITVTPFDLIGTPLRSIAAYILTFDDVTSTELVAPSTVPKCKRCVEVDG